VFAEQHDFIRTAQHGYLAEQQGNRSIADDNHAFGAAEQHAVSTVHNTG
jgi:hypothetical protein